MGKRLAHICTALGILLMIGSGYLYLFTRAEDRMAANASAQILPQIKTQIAHAQTAPSEPETHSLSVTVEDSEYIGYLSIPALELELPVMTDWNYEKLKQSPCRYTGSLWEGDLVIMAHNYDHHFGKLSTLSPGDSIFFVDAQGITSQFQVGALDILVPTAVAEVTENEHDLTLFTCTYGGKNRVTVFCDRVISQ